MSSKCGHAIDGACTVRDSILENQLCDTIEIINSQSVDEGKKDLV